MTKLRTSRWWWRHSNCYSNVYFKSCHALILLACTAFFAQKRDFMGTLEPELTLPSRVHQVSDFAITTEAERKTMAGMVGSGDKVFTGKVRGLLTFVVEPAGGPTIVYVDVNADRRISANEAFSLRPGLDSLQTGIATVLLPLAGPYYTHYPVDVYVYRKQKREDSRMVGESPRAFARGRVKVDGKPLIVEYEFDLKANTVRLDSGWQGMDINRDGEVNRSPQSLESFFARNEVLVFHVGNLYLSTKALDLGKGEVVLQPCPPSAYHTIELTAGGTLPDLSFKDFSGHTRTLSEFRGKYVLLDFWATWCGPCVGDMPHLRQIYDRFHARGLEIVGMNGDEDEPKAREMIAEKSLGWIHATYASIRQTLERSFRIRAWPAYVLLDREGKILSSRDEDLRGAALDRTLERLMP